MRYGTVGYGAQGTGGSGGGPSAIIYKGTIDDASVVDLILTAGALYELFTAEYNASTGAYRGHRSRLIKAPEADVFGTTASQTINESASTNSGVTITMNADSSVSISRSSATYAVKYVLRAVGTNIGNPSSAIAEAEAARDAAQGYATAAESAATLAEASATAAETASEHYPKIENGYWYVWDPYTSTWANTNVKAQGETGATPNLTIGTVTTGAAGSQADATITGTTEEPVLNLTIPRGNDGVSGGLLMKLIWTNPNPTATFAAQTVSIDLSGYDAVMVLARTFTSTDANVALVSAFTLIGEYGYLELTSPVSNNTGARRFNVTSSGIDFERCGYNGGAQNNYLVPQRIYGIKGIT